MTAAIYLADQDDSRIILPVVAAKCEIPLLWQDYKRVSGPEDSGLEAVEAARRVIHILALTPASTATAPSSVSATEKAADALERGNSLREQDRPVEALDAFEQAITLNPRYAEAWHGKGWALKDLKRYDEALTAYERATTLDPQYTLAWNNRIALLEQLGRKGEAEQVRRERDAALATQG